jgi:8-oxo-dGTP pyrophosphatase MutT (NUDIX family)
LLRSEDPYRLLPTQNLLVRINRRTDGGDLTPEEDIALMPFPQDSSNTGSIRNPTVTSAGGFIVSRQDDEWVTVLVGHKTPTIWRVPKGMQNQGETIEETAIREVQEETGFLASIVTLVGIGRWTYKYGGIDWDETCYFFLMRLQEGNIVNHDAEFDQVAWFPLIDAHELLCYSVEKQMAQIAVQVLTSVLPAFSHQGDHYAPYEDE